MTDTLEMPSFSDEIRAAQKSRAATIRVKSEPLTYRRDARVSYFKDLLISTPDGNERLARHRQEMDVIGKERDDRAWRALRAGEFETRVEPDRTDGTGGYFSPPLWLNQLFTTAKRPGRVLAGLIPGTFPLPAGVSQINLPILTTGTINQSTPDLAGVPDQDIVDAAGSSAVATFSGEANVALQLLEQSPAGAMLDWAIFMDLAQAYDFSLETQLLYGLGSAAQQLSGVVPAAGVAVTYTDASPTGPKMWPYLAQAAAQLGDARLLPPEVWLMRTARWAWLAGSETTTGAPIVISPFFLGSDPDMPDPISGVMGWPVFLDDAISATLGAGGNQDQVIPIRPSDLLLFESTPQTAVIREPGSGSLSVKIQMHSYAAAITRYTQGVATIGGTGFVVQSGY
jgi:hypothetical protein